MLGLVRPVFLEAVPEENIERAPGGAFVCSGGTFALAPPAGGFPTGWVEINVQLAAPEELATPRLLASAAGSREALTIALPRPRDGIVRSIVRLPREIGSLRLQPSDRVVSVRLGTVAMRPLSVVEAASRLGLRLAGEMLREPWRIRPAVGKLVSIARQGGFKGLKYRVLERARRGYGRPSYTEWIEVFDKLHPSDIAAIRRRIDLLPRRPRFSLLLPLRVAGEDLLRQAIGSLRAQLYPEWELCIASPRTTAARPIVEEAAAQDPRIRTCLAEDGEEQAALDLARGDYVAVLDPGDELAPHALYLLAEEICARGEVDLLYSDEDKIDDSGRRYDPDFKPRFSPDLLLSRDYFSRLCAYRTELVRRCGGFRAEFRGAEEYDLSLRCVAAGASVANVPFVLCHRRDHPPGPAVGEAGRSALQRHLDLSEPGAIAEPGAAEALYRVRHPLPDPPVLVTLIVPTRDGYALLRQCVESLARTTYTNRELIVIDNQSRDPQTLRYFDELRESGVARILPFDRPFNYSAINNLAVREAKGDVICLLNNDVEVIAPEWLSELVAHALRSEVGAVGAKLRYPDGSLQHAGVVVGLGGVAGHGQRSLPRDAPGYQRQAQVTRNVSAVTAACLAIRKEVYLSVGGLDERLAVAFNDVDFCLRVREAGYLNVWTPHAELYHHESKTRGIDDTPEKKARFRGEFEFMKARWGDRLANDPFYSPNLTVETEDFSVAWPPRVRRPWRER